MPLSAPAHDTDPSDPIFVTKSWGNLRRTCPWRIWALQTLPRFFRRATASYKSKKKWQSLGLPFWMLAEFGLVVSKRTHSPDADNQIVWFLLSEVSTRLVIVLRCFKMLQVIFHPGIIRSKLPKIQPSLKDQASVPLLKLTDMDSQIEVFWKKFGLESSERFGHW